MGKDTENYEIYFKLKKKIKMQAPNSKQYHQANSRLWDKKEKEYNKGGKYFVLNLRIIFFSLKKRKRGEGGKKYGLFFFCKSVNQYCFNIVLGKNLFFERVYRCRIKNIKKIRWWRKGKDIF